MRKEGKCKPHVEGRPVNRVSSAVWPLNVRRVVATDKAAQRRRDWIMQERWWVVPADALSLRILLVFAMLLVVISSLCVAVLGLYFWYLLLLPLLLFTSLLAMPSVLARRAPREAAPPTLSIFAQEFRSSAGRFSSYTQELRSNPGFLQELRSSPGIPQELRTHPGVLSAETPTTPMPADQPLVRVLETYDLREVQARQRSGESLREETGEYKAL